MSIVVDTVEVQILKIHSSYTYVVCTSRSFELIMPNHIQ